MLKNCFADINECQTDNGGCSQTCENTNGSYHCSCSEGYQLTDNGYTCDGNVYNNTLCITLWEQLKVWHHYVTDESRV